MKNTLVAVAFALCALTSCMGNTVGLTCTKNADCSDTYTCFTQLSGGFCSRGCDIEGNTTDCPANTVCAPIAQGVNACSPTCTDDAQCHASLKCAGVNTYAGKVCRKP